MVMQQHEDVRYGEIRTRWVSAFQVRIKETTGMSDEAALEIAQSVFNKNLDVIDPRRAASLFWRNMRTGDVS